MKLTLTFYRHYLLIRNNRIVKICIQVVPLKLTSTHCLLLKMNYYNRIIWLPKDSGIYTLWYLVRKYTQRMGVAVFPRSTRTSYTECDNFSIPHPMFTSKQVIHTAKQVGSFLIKWVCREVRLKEFILKNELL
jgi:hypothetical protein